MTETVHPQAPPAIDLAPTPLAALLTQAAAPPALAAHCGVLTPDLLDAPGRETETLAFGAAAHDLGWLRLVAVRGEDRFRWLSGMVTNTVYDLPANTGLWNLVLNAQGRIQGDLHVWRDGDNLTLTIAADQYDRLLTHFTRHIIMDDVELVPLSLDADGNLTGETALGLTGPMAVGVLERLGLPVLSHDLTFATAKWNDQPIRVIRAYGVLAPHFELWVQAGQLPALRQALIEAGATPVGVASLEAFRIAEGIAAYGIDIAERDLPQETSQMRALSFGKGCYLGQEIVERIRSRGSVHRHLRPLELFGPLPAAGAELTLDSGASAGQITSAAEWPLPAGNRTFAFGMIRAEAEIRSQPLNYTAGEAAGTARILASPPSFQASQHYE